MSDARIGSASHTTFPATRSGHAAIEAAALTKRYPAADQPALEDFDLHVEPGTVRALLGSNRAGKTTVINILSTLLTASSGTARIAGFDVATQAHRVRQSISVVAQDAAVDELLTARQNLILFARLIGLTKQDARSRAARLLTDFWLSDAADRPVGNYSGGMRRRLDLAASMITQPAVLFVDEPTSGLDPQARRELWKMLHELVSEGATLLLTTQYLEEADELADRINMIGGGRNIAEGTAEELKHRIGSSWVEIGVAEHQHYLRILKLLTDAGFPILQSGADKAPHARASIRVGLSQRRQVIGVSVLLERAGIPVTDVELGRPTLEDVFIQLVSDDHYAAGDTAAVNA